MPSGRRPRASSFFEMNMRREAIWCILRHNFEKCYSDILFYFLSRDHVLTMFHLAPIFANVNRRVTRHV